MSSLLPDLLPILYGAVVGLSLGLTGGGGSIFAVPLLIYGLDAGVRPAVGISLAAVGATALFGALMRRGSGDLEWRTSLLFAAGGMSGAPLGIWIGGRIPDVWTLTGFALLMAFVGLRMWRNAAPRARAADSACLRDDRGELRWSSRCGVVLALTGILTGVLSGIFGVGGGFIIVPALILVSGMGIHRAVASSLLVIALICVSGVASYVGSGSGLPLGLTLWFVGGGFLGMLGGDRLRRRLPGAALERVFAVGMWAVAAFVLWQQTGMGAD